MAAAERTQVETIEQAAARAARESGVPEKVTDPQVLAQVARLMLAREGRDDGVSQRR